MQINLSSRCQCTRYPSFTRTSHSSCRGKPTSCAAPARATNTLGSSCRASLEEPFNQAGTSADASNGSTPCQQQEQSAACLSSSLKGASSSTSSVTTQSSVGRQFVLRGTLAPLLVQLAIGSDDATTLVNSVLSAYGLPTFKAASGFKLYDEFEDEFYFEYPKSWVARPNSLRRGVYISDFQTADKVTVEESELPEDGDITTAAVAAAVAPGGGKLQDDRINLPSQRLIKTSKADVYGQEILYLEFPSETITRSGYNIRRKNYAAAAVKRDKLYTIAASARSDQFNEEKKVLLQHIVQSFRLK